MIPVTVFTGSLGAGKTTIIKNLVDQLDLSYKTLWLKNEYGDVNIDSELAKESNIETKEILNGCLCCVLVGKLHEALEEIVKSYELDRLIIETAGTAYPGPIVQQIEKVNQLKLDGLVTVIDTLNFQKFYDKSFLAKKEARFVDLVIMNKTGLVEQAQLDFVEDEVYELYPGKTIIQSENGNIDRKVLLGIDRKQVRIEIDEHDHVRHTDKVDIFSFESDNIFDIDSLTSFLNDLNAQDFYRIKGIVRTSTGFKLLNYVLGRIEWQNLEKYNGKSKITFMGKGVAGLEEKVINDLTRK